MAEGDDPFALDTHDGRGVLAPPLVAEHVSRADALAFPDPLREENRQQEDESLLREREPARDRRQMEVRPAAVEMTGADYVRYVAGCRDFEQQHGNRQPDKTDPQEADVRRSARSTR